MKKKKNKKGCLRQPFVSSFIFFVCPTSCEKEKRKEKRKERKGKKRKDRGEKTEKPIMNRRKKRNVVVRRVVS